jgi:hypothetical protein
MIPIESVYFIVLTVVLLMVSMSLECWIFKQKKTSWEMKTSYFTGWELDMSC